MATLKARFLAECTPQIPWVISAPPGSGKSTQVPQWATQLRHPLQSKSSAPSVWVVVPRRIACMALASWVAHCDGDGDGDGDGALLGERVGFVVRDRAMPGSQITFMTPGIFLRRWAKYQNQPLPCTSIVIDEIHERSLEQDLILGLLLHARRCGDLARQPHWILMSATIDGGRIAKHVDGVHVEALGRIFPVTVHHVGQDALLPTMQGLEARLLIAMARCRDLAGDVLIFLPGKGEMAQIAQALQAMPEVANKSWRVMHLHGGLSLADQEAVFASCPKRKILLATNVAETALTVPGIGVVIDSGLVRETRYHRGRGYLARVPIAMDRAEQRCGRAGRLAPGVAFRLWQAEGQLQVSTLPEIHRQDLGAWVLSAYACGAQPENLPLLDPPTQEGLKVACEALEGLGAICHGALSPVGKALFGLPLDPALARWLLAGQNQISEHKQDVLPWLLLLVGALAQGRSLYAHCAVGSPAHAAQAVWKEQGCDVQAHIAMMRMGRDWAAYGIDARAHADAWVEVQRLAPLVGLASTRLPQKHQEASHAPFMPSGLRRALLETIIQVDAGVVHIARNRRDAQVFWGGGSEVMLAKHSALDAQPTQFAAMLSWHGHMQTTAKSKRRAVLHATCAAPIPIAWLKSSNLGEKHIVGAKVQGGALLYEVERILLGKTLETGTFAPKGKDFLAALAFWIVDGQWQKDWLAAFSSRCRILDIAWQFKRAAWITDVPNLAHMQRMHGDDMACPPPCPNDAAAWLIEHLPRVDSFLPTPPFSGVRA